MLLLATLVTGSGLIIQKKAARRSFLWPLKDSQAASWGLEEGGHPSQTVFPMLGRGAVVQSWQGPGAGSTQAVS